MKFLIIILTVIVYSFQIGYCAVPRLIVVISFDQMRGDYPKKWEKLWGEKGFNRLRKEGQSFSNCYYNHATNMTCPGHSVIMTGSYPARTGIVSNDFFDRKLGKECYCVQNTIDKNGTKAEDGRSADLLMKGTLGDFLQNYYPNSQVMSIGLKDRAGILMAGHLAKTVLWYDENLNILTTTAPYKFPVWLTSWNKKHSATFYENKVWNTEIPDSIGEIDNIHWEGDFPGGNKVFPHGIPSAKDKNFTEAFLESPSSMEYLFDAAKVTITNEKLGKDENPDLFHIAVSTTDYCGHVFGPDSRELQELYVHADKMLGEFIDYLDKSFGRKKYVLVVTSDHGVGPIPELLNEQGRVKIEAGRLSKSKIFSAMNEYLAKQFLPIGSKDYLLDRIELPSVFIDESILTKYELKKEIVLDTLIAFTKRIDGIKYVASLDKLMGEMPQDWDEEVWELVKNDMYFDRTGEMIVYPKPYWIFGNHTATHGTMYNYDRYVPLMFFGGDIKAGESTLKVSPADIAPTLGRKLRVFMPYIDGKELDVWLDK